MKNFYLATILFLSTTISFAAPRITAVSNGSWTSASTWNMNRKPQPGDTIIIPVNRTVTLSASENLTSGAVYIRVLGVLRLNFGQLYLHNASTILLFDTGEIVSLSLLFDWIQIGGVTKFWGWSTPSLDGPLVANASSGNGFAGINLPVKFTGFNVARQNNQVLVEWSTAEESNASHYEIQRSQNGTDWTTIDSVAAAGNSSTAQNYSYTDRNPVGTTIYYRLRQVDIDRKYVITQVRVVKMNGETGNVKIYSPAGNTVNIHFPQKINSNVVVRIMNMSGQLLEQQTLNKPVGQVMIHTRSTSIGACVVNVSNGEELTITKQVIL